MPRIYAPGPCWTGFDPERNAWFANCDECGALGESQSRSSMEERAYEHNLGHRKARK